MIQTVLGSSSNNGIEKWTNLDYLKEKISEEENVMVEKRKSNTDSFGQGNEISMSFHNFIDLIQKGDNKHYLTTQDVEATTTTTTNLKSSTNDDDGENNNDAVATCDDDDHNDEEEDDNDYDALLDDSGDGDINLDLIFTTNFLGHFLLFN